MKGDILTNTDQYGGWKMLIRNWIMEVNAKKRVCPFSMSAPDDACMCLGERCMAWVADTEDSDFGTCSLLPSVDTDD